MRVQASWPERIRLIEQAAVPAQIVVPSTAAVKLAFAIPRRSTLGIFESALTFPGKLALVVEFARSAGQRGLGL